MENIREYEIIPSNTTVDIPEPIQVQEKLNKIRMYQQVVQKQLIPGIDYGQMEGQKSTLLKPGAEKLIRIHGLIDRYEILEKIENWDSGFFYYMIKCTLIHYDSGKIVAEGIGSCNSKESKYRWRWVTEKDLPANIDKNILVKKTMQGQYGTYTLYKVENDETFSLVNTIQKMAKKRALIDAALSACRLSSVFTQDIDDEDITNGINGHITEKPATQIKPQPQTQPQTRPQVKPTAQQQIKPQAKPATQPVGTESEGVTGKEILQLKKALFESGKSEKEIIEIIKNIKNKDQLTSILASLKNKQNEQENSVETFEGIPEEIPNIPDEFTLEEPF